MPTAELGFMFADLSGFTALTEAHGDLDAADVATRFLDLASEASPPGVRIVKTIGDAVMFAADAAPSLVPAAVRLLDLVEAVPSFPGVRMGIHAGSAVERDGDYIGGAVNLAARLADHARGGQILCTEPVARLTEPDDAFEVRPAGVFRPRNLPEPVPMYEVLRRGRSSEDNVTDPVCRMQLLPSSAPARLPYRGTTYYFCSLTCAETFVRSPGSHVGEGGVTGG